MTGFVIKVDDHPTAWACSRNCANATEHALDGVGDSVEIERYAGQSLTDNRCSCGRAPRATLDERLRATGFFEGKANDGSGCPYVLSGRGWERRFSKAQAEAFLLGIESRA